MHLCGRLVARLAGERIEDRLPGRQGRLLFAYLTVNRRRVVSRDELVELLWPRDLPAVPGRVLNPLVSKLRHAVGEDVLRGRSELRLLLPPAAFVDVEAAAEAIHRAESYLASERPHDAFGPACVARYVAERRFLPDGEGAWVGERRRELAELLIRALECDARVALSLSGTEVPAAARSARRLVELAPYRDNGYRLLMEALEQEGNIVEALLVYERFRLLLKDELGTIPSADMLRLHERLLSRGAAPT